MIINQERTNELIGRILQAIKGGRGFFAFDYKKFLPQYNIPKELENNPWTRLPKDPKSAAQFLYFRNSLDRRVESGYLTRCALEVWHNPKYNWIFQPAEVAKRTELELEQVIKEQFHIGLRDTGKYALQNARVLVAEYDGDPRNLIKGKTVEQSMQEQEAKLGGIGVGLANLLQIQYRDRELAFPTDPEKLRLKIDVWKGSILCNVKACVPEKEFVMRHDTNVRAQADSYLAACRHHNLTDEQIVELDGALWALGSVVCKRKNKRLCEVECPLYDLCSRVTWNDFATVFEFDQDPRKDTGQNILPFYS